jgi:hypothetical protein
MKWQLDRSVLDVISEPAQLAAQLLVIEQERLMNIGPEEFVLTFGKSDSPHDMVVFFLVFFVCFARVLRVTYYVPR